MLAHTLAVNNVPSAASTFDAKFSSGVLVEVKAGEVRDPALHNSWRP